MNEPIPSTWQCPACLVIYAPHMNGCACIATRKAAHPPPNLVRMCPPKPPEEDTSQGVLL